MINMTQYNSHVSEHSLDYKKKIEKMTFLSDNHDDNESFTGNWFTINKEKCKTNKQTTEQLYYFTLSLITRIQLFMVVCFVFVLML